MQVPDDLLDKKVQCPECQHTFIATAQGEEDAEKLNTGTTSSLPVSLTAAA